MSPRVFLSLFRWFRKNHSDENTIHIYPADTSRLLGSIKCNYVHGLICVVYGLWIVIFHQSSVDWLTVTVNYSNINDGDLQVSCSLNIAQIFSRVSAHLQRLCTHAVTVDKQIPTIFLIMAIWAQDFHHRKVFRIVPGKTFGFLALLFSMLVSSCW